MRYVHAINNLSTDSKSSYNMWNTTGWFNCILHIHVANMTMYGSYHPKRNDVLFDYVIIEAGCSDNLSVCIKGVEGLLYMVHLYVTRMPLYMIFQHQPRSHMKETFACHVSNLSRLRELNRACHQQQLEAWKTTQHMSMSYQSHICTRVGSGLPQTWPSMSLVIIRN